MEVLFTETGAADPNFNLRTEPGLILRVTGASDFTFVSLLEPHGEYNGSREFTTASASNVRDLKRVSETSSDIVRITGKNGDSTTVAISWDANPDARHSAALDGLSINWSGFYDVIEGRGSLE